MIIKAVNGVVFFKIMVNQNDCTSKFNRFTNYVTVNENF